MDGLNFDNILNSEEVDNLFVDDSDEETQDAGNPDENPDNENTKTTEVNPDTLFTDGPESVSGDDEEKDEEDNTPSDNEEGISPDNFYSSMARALKEEGVFPTLDEGIIADIHTAEDFRELMEYLQEEKLTAAQKRANDALSYGVQPSDIQTYEKYISYIDSITDEELTAETEQGEYLRKNLIYQDFLNRGYSKERANKEVQKSINAGTDIEDAREALTGNRDYYVEAYNNVVEEAKRKKKEEEDAFYQDIDYLRDSIYKDNDAFADFEVDDNTRRRVFDNIVKPVYTDPKTGEQLTAIQKYERDNHLDYVKNVSLLFTLTNGFRDMDGLTNKKVNREVKKGLRSLENKINNTSRTSDGSLKYVTGVSEEPESFFSKNWKLDV